MDNNKKGVQVGSNKNLNLTTRKGRLLIAALQKERDDETSINDLKDSQQHSNFDATVPTAATVSTDSSNSTNPDLPTSKPVLSTSNESDSEFRLITLSDLGVEPTAPTDLETNSIALPSYDSETELQLLTQSDLALECSIRPENIEVNVDDDDDDFRPSNRNNTHSFTTLTRVDPNFTHSFIDQPSTSPSLDTNARSTIQFDFDSDDSIRDRTFNPTNETNFSSSSTSSDDDGEEPENTVVTANRRRQRPNKRKIIQAKRNKGERYETKSGRVVEERRVTALTQCRMKCSEKITRQDQETLCKELWSIGDYNKRTDYLASLILDVQKKTARIRSTDTDPKPRTINHTYHLKLNGNMMQVCKVCFLKTFAITNKTIEVITKKKSEKLSGIVNSDRRGSSVPPNKISEDKIKAIKDHINSYPVYESHYSRRHTAKKYLPKGLSISIMYEMYKVKVSDPVSYAFFGKVFRTMGLSFKKPALDTCNTCDSLNMKIKVGPPQDVEELKKQLLTHQSEADAAYKMKKEDKKKCSASKRVYSFDLQQCLATPFLQTNIVFYKRLLWTFNLTIFDCFTKKSYCYMWHEAVGGRGANQIASCLFNFISNLPPEIKEVTFYSDTCGGQNKNSHVVAMFLCLTKLRPDLKIEHKFLVPGHTHMECDTVHAQIERKKKTTGMTIHLPRDWYNLVRSTNKKMNVIVMSNDMFLNFSLLYKGPFQLRKVDSSGEKFVWHDVKWFYFSGQYETGTVKFKTQLSESDTFKDISFCRRGKANQNLQPQKCYDGPVPISEEKKKDLLSILHLIENDCHDFYKCLPSTLQNTIDDPDLEDFNEE